ncbi:hypothetical protein HYH03_014367 [Edaphochlamys debaryana]|uniref:Uncharacterized protein n=1 Tax=Edaphochlamys debaryana TaxID=47281 RepID=A0A835XU84_9CHLO|nr:hypothetical protein HYH03_014367 [Edaphochlamys debaryana]|eukprot:KAG2486995.1 hypothetical protein HYH03_014367 [Edaphochlamys debaryana]
MIVVETLVALVEHTLLCEPTLLGQAFSRVLLAVGGGPGTSRAAVADVVPETAAVGILRQFACVPSDVRPEAILEELCAWANPVTGGGGADERGGPALGFGMNRVVPLDVLVALLTVVGSGGLEERASCAFWTLDRDGAGYLVLEQLQRLTGLLTAVAAAGRLLLGLSPFPYPPPSVGPDSMRRRHTAVRVDGGSGHDGGGGSGGVSGSSFSGPGGVAAAAAMPAGGSLDAVSKALLESSLGRAFNEHCCAPDPSLGLPARLTADRLALVIQSTAAHITMAVVQYATAGGGAASMQGMAHERSSAPAVHPGHHVHAYGHGHVHQPSFGRHRGASISRDSGAQQAAAPLAGSVAGAPLSAGLALGSRAGSRDLPYLNQPSRLAVHDSFGAAGSTAGPGEASLFPGAGLSGAFSDGGRSLSGRPYGTSGPAVTGPYGTYQRQVSMERSSSANAPTFGTGLSAGGGGPTSPSHLRLPVAADGSAAPPAPPRHAVSAGGQALTSAGMTTSTVGRVSGAVSRLGAWAYSSASAGGAWLGFGRRPTQGAQQLAAGLGLPPLSPPPPLQHSASARAASAAGAGPGLSSTDSRDAQSAPAGAAAAAGMGAPGAAGEWSASAADSPSRSGRPPPPGPGPPSAKSLHSLIAPPYATHAGPTMLDRVSENPAYDIASTSAAANSGRGDGGGSSRDTLGTPSRPINLVGAAVFATPSSASSAKPGPAAAGTPGGGDGAAAAGGGGGDADAGGDVSMELSPLPAAGHAIAAGAVAAAGSARGVGLLNRWRRPSAAAVAKSSPGDAGGLASSPARHSTAGIASAASPSGGGGTPGSVVGPMARSSRPSSATLIDVAPNTSSPFRMAFGSSAHHPQSPPGTTGGGGAGGGRYEDGGGGGGSAMVALELSPMRGPGMEDSGAALGGPSARAPLFLGLGLGDTGGAGEGSVRGGNAGGGGGGGGTPTLTAGGAASGGGGTLPLGGAGVASPDGTGHHPSFAHAPHSLEEAVNRAEVAAKAEAAAAASRGAAAAAAAGGAGGAGGAPAAAAAAGGAGAGAGGAGAAGSGTVLPPLQRTIRSHVQQAGVRLFLHCGVCLLSIIALLTMDAALVAWVYLDRRERLSVSLVIVAATNAGLVLLVLVISIVRSCMADRTAALEAQAAAQRAAGGGGGGGGGGGIAEFVISNFVTPALRTMGVIRGPEDAARSDPNTPGGHSAGGGGWGSRLRLVWTTIGRVAGFDAMHGEHGGGGPLTAMSVVGGRSDSRIDDRLSRDAGGGADSYRRTNSDIEAGRDGHMHGGGAMQMHGAAAGGSVRGGRANMQPPGMGMSGHMGMESTVGGSGLYGMDQGLTSGGGGGGMMAPGYEQLSHGNSGGGGLDRSDSRGGLGGGTSGGLSAGGTGAGGGGGGSAARQRTRGVAMGLSTMPTSRRVEQAYPAM